MLLIVDFVRESIGLVVNKWCCVANRAERPDPDRGIASFPYTMYRGGMTDKELDDEIERADAKDSPWGKFLLETIRLDIYHEKPRGWHWFCAFKDLSGSDLKEIQKTLPEQHPFKSITPKQSFLVPELTDAVLLLKNALKITGDIEEINFSRLKFENADFLDFIFPVKVSFEDARFYKEAVFVRAIFVDDANFNGTVFNKEILLYEAIFNAKLSFNRAVFRFVAFFKGVKFFGGANFAYAKFRNAVVFSDSIFFGEAFFDGINTRSHTEFFNTSFKKYPPSMHDAVIYSGINWDRNVNLWPHPQIREDDETDTEYKYMLRIIQNAYENLASQMKNMDKYHDEHFFYRQEMRCRRWLEENPFISFSYWLYEAVSDYGYGIERALLWWFLHILLGAILIGATTKSVYNKTCDLAGNFYLDMVVSFANAHGVLFFKDGALKKCYMKFDALPVFNFIWGVQTIFGILFLFLLLLTLRIRFRLK